MASILALTLAPAAVPGPINPEDGAPQVHLSTPNVMASVPVTVAANPTPAPAPNGVTKPLPKRLRKFRKVKSLTPKVCTVKNRKVLVKKSGLRKPKGGTIVVKQRY